VLAFGKRVRTALPRLDTLISNAGVALMDFTLAEGVEITITQHQDLTTIISLLAAKAVERFRVLIIT
jgi:hypothetical protein